MNGAQLSQGYRDINKIINKIKNKLRMKAIKYACFKLEEKATRSIKKKKKYFISVIGD